MPKTLLLVLTLLVAGPTAQGQFGVRSGGFERAAQYRRLVTEFDMLYRDLPKDLRDAKTPEQREAIQAGMARLVREYAPEFMAIANENPKDAIGLEALGWVARRAMSGTEFDAALELLAEHHPGVPGLEVICRRLLYHQTEKAGKFLESVINNNPDGNVRGAALTVLAIFTKRAYEQGGDKALAAKAEKLFGRAWGEFNAVRSPGRSRRPNRDSVRAQREFEDLRGPAAIGKTAPDIEGQDLDGIEFKLSDYRGKIVVLLFWNMLCKPCRELGWSLESEYADEPVAVIGVNFDKERKTAREFVERERIPWRSFWYGETGPNGPITKAWGIRGSTTVYVLDAQGRIRYKFVWGALDSLDQRLETLLAELK